MSDIDWSAIPKMRAMLPQLIANDIVGVQPMQSPSGSIFNMKYTYIFGTVTITDSGITVCDGEEDIPLNDFINIHGFDKIHEDYQLILKDLLGAWL
ncbi:MAG: hypothetical protein DRQ39_07225 [Gammaproteobacteria bacterium]|nr:MAG: hypothetical protein DRQ39_07225 [Gammaproteobacteria bacterium]